MRAAETRTPTRRPQPRSGRRPATAVLAALVLVSVCLPAAAETALTAVVDRARATQSEPIRLTLTLTSDRSLDHVEAPSLDLSDFDVFGPSVSTRVQIVNGQTAFARELTYTLYGRRTGRFRIGPASLEVAGRTLTTKPIDVTIVRSRRAAGGQAGGGQAGGGQAAAPGGDQDKATLEDVLFVRAAADADTVYVGQQVVVRFDLCYRVNLRDVGFSEIPTFTGFWTKDLFVAQRLAPQRETIDGADFNVAPLRRVALFPTQAGTQRIEPLAVSASIPQGHSRNSLFDALSLFDDPLFGRSQNTILRSLPLTIEVLPLPEAGRPADFAGAVGQFVLRAEAQPRQVRAGDPVTLRLEIEGDGNLQSIPEPSLDLPGFEVYDPTVEVKDGNTPTGGYGGRKTLEYILIPEASGRQRIRPVTISFFDPAARRYRTLSSPAFDIDVEGGPAAAAGGPALDMTRSEIEQLGRDIRHIKPDVDSLGAPVPLYRSPIYWLAHLLLPVAFAGFVAYERHLRRLQGDEAYARRRRARGEMTRRLQAARERVEADDGFHATLQEAVVAYIADQLNRPPAGLTRDGCRQLLVERQVPASVVDAVDGLLERLEFGRFAPGASRADDRRALLAEGEELLERLREALS